MIPHWDDGLPVVEPPDYAVLLRQVRRIVADDHRVPADVVDDVAQDVLIKLLEAQQSGRWVLSIGGAVPRAYIARAVGWVVTSRARLLARRAGMEERAGVPVWAMGNQGVPEGLSEAQEGASRSQGYPRPSARSEGAPRGCQGGRRGTQGAPGRGVGVKVGDTHRGVLLSAFAREPVQKTENRGR